MGGGGWGWVDKRGYQTLAQLMCCRRHLVILSHFLTFISVRSSKGAQSSRRMGEVSSFFLFFPPFLTSKRPLALPLSVSKKKKKRKMQKPKCSWGIVHGPQPWHSMSRWINQSQTLSPGDLFARSPSPIFSFFQLFAWVLFLCFHKGERGTVISQWLFNASCGQAENGVGGGQLRQQIWTISRAIWGNRKSRFDVFYWRGRTYWVRQSFFKPFISSVSHWPQTLMGSKFMTTWSTVNRCC